MKKDLLIGIITGLVANLLGIFLYVWFLPPKGFNETLRNALETGYIGKIVAIGAIFNLIAFFLYLKKNQDQRAKGVLVVTLLIGITVIILKLI